MTVKELREYLEGLEKEGFQNSEIWCDFDAGLGTTGIHQHHRIWNNGKTVILSGD